MRDERGIVLVLTLMILALITAMVVEFAYGVYTTTSALANWKELQRLAFVSKSGISLAVKTISDIPQSERYRFPGALDIPVGSLLQDFQGTVLVRVEDENAKFNLNSLVGRNKTLNMTAYKTFTRLLSNLGLDETIAQRVADWMGQETLPRLKGSKEGAKNAFLDSVDEILLIQGIDSLAYGKLSPYVTVYGYSDICPICININTASVPVIMSLNDGIGKELAERVIHSREMNPFKDKGELGNVPGFPLTPETSGMIVVSPSNYRITSTAEENKIKRVIESVVVISGTGSAVSSFWREQ